MIRMDEEVELLDVNGSIGVVCPACGNNDEFHISGRFGVLGKNMLQAEWVVVHCLCSEYIELDPGYSYSFSGQGIIVRGKLGNNDGEASQEAD